MGLYFTKCEKCGHIGWFCSVNMTSNTCDCNPKYKKECDSKGNLIKPPKHIYYKMSEGGGAHIIEINNTYQLYEIPLYGGEETYINTFNTLQDAKNEVDTWK